MIYFDSPLTGECIFNANIVGESGTENAGFIYEGKPTNSLVLNLKENERFRLDVEFARRVKDLALEATIIQNEEVNET